ncbi:formin-1-like [Microcaecilia unicolor]|uniref:Formin-1-like n=1 Tax=Microcaecilia unicolor TaxID=1415580 RepID=A0A6P7YS94_9AMPH|nr:formin-1-like [Microcaecilia unicolor]
MIIMEGCHTTLQLLPPITELWYVSLYFPRPRAGGFTHCSTVRDRARDTSGKCWEPQEKLWTAKQRAHWDVNLREILTQLYRLSADEEKLLANLLSSHLLLDNSMGNQDGKLQEVGLRRKEDDSSNPRNQQEFFTGEKRPDSRAKKSRKFSRRRESVGEFLNNKIKRKVSGGQESSWGAISRDTPSWKQRALSDSSLQGSSDCSWLHSLENKDESVVLEINNKMGMQRKERSLLESTGTTDSDTDHGSSLYEFGNNIITDSLGLSHSKDVLRNVVHTMEMPQHGENSPCLKHSLKDSLLERSQALGLSSTETHDWCTESYILQAGPAFAPKDRISLEQQRTTDTMSSSQLQCFSPGQSQLRISRL